MTFLGFYLLGVLIVFYLQLCFTPYEYIWLFGVTKKEYIIKLLLPSLLSWGVILILIFVFLENRRG